MSGSQRLTREQLLAIASQHALGAIHDAEMRTLMGCPAKYTTTSAASGRTFVCQGCGKAQTVRTTSLACSCGTTSAAEVLA